MMGDYDSMVIVVWRYYWFVADAINNVDTCGSEG